MDKILTKIMHTWDLKPKEAIALQKELASELILEFDGRRIDSIGGVDVSIRDDKAICAVVALSYPELEPLESAVATDNITYPYVPGLLTFREGPVFEKTWAKIERKPDVLMFDGQGIAHPRRMGIAAHMGLRIDTPTVGVGKTRLFGKFVEPDSDKGDSSDLIDPKTSLIIGKVIRSRNYLKPIFVSPGHRMDVEKAKEIALRCCVSYKIPEPTRLAHRVAGGEKLF